jgi:hypothetical protein
MDRRRAVNPFAMMTNPEAVFRAIENSDRLCMLERRVCRPLDKPLIPCADELAEFDNSIDGIDFGDTE